MTNEMMEIYDQFHEAAHGKEKMEICRRGWELADQSDSYDDQYFFRYKYINEAAFYDDILEIYTIYPVLLQKHDAYVAVHGSDPNTFHILWAYKWVLENAHEFHQISIEQFERFREDFRIRCIKNGYSLRPYYQYGAYFYSQFDMEKAETCYRNFLKCPHDGLSDCKACERHMEVVYLLRTNQPDKAMERAKDLFSRRLTCAEVPDITYAEFIRYDNMCRLKGEAFAEMDIHNLQRNLYYSIDSKKLCIEHIGKLFLSYCFTDKGMALEWFRRNCTYTQQVRNPVFRFEFAIAAMALFKELLSKETYKMRLKKEFVLYREDDEYSPREIYGHFRKMAEEIACKMDARNGNDVFTLILRDVENGF